METVTASIVVPVYNDFEVFSKTFTALLDQSYRDGVYEIIIVDDCSTDGIGEYFQEKKYYQDCKKYSFDIENIIYVKNKENSGRSKTRNNGIRAARGELIVFLDSDKIPAREFLAEHIGAHNETEGIVTCGRVSFPQEVLHSKFMRFWNKRYTANNRFTDKKPIPFYYPGVANGSVKKSDLVEVNMFNEDFVNYGGEDEELWYRLCIIGGLRNIYLEHAHAVHEDSTFTYKNFLQRIKVYGRYAAPIITKYHRDYFKTKILTRYLEPIAFEKESVFDMILKLCLRIATKFPIGTFAEFITKRLEFKRYIPLPLSLYGLVICRYYRAGVRER